MPIVLTSFIGRKRETEDVKRLLASSRLVTLTGAAGCGKTRLALHLAEDASNHYVNGVYWVELAPLDDARLVPQAVARTLDVTEQPGHSLTEVLLETLDDKQLLLVLDNCEHVLSACTELVETLLAATDVYILITSREPFGIAGEVLYSVEPLSLPPMSMTTDQIEHFDAIRLFVERSRAILPAFELTRDNATEVAGICHRLDGIPLAIEIASARVNVLTVEQITARLDDCFELLTIELRISHSHHHTLRAAIDWSYDLLSPSEQVMLQRLSVFRGGCSLTTAEKVCVGGNVERDHVIDLLSSLVNKSLVVAQTLGVDEARYLLLEIIREYGQEKLIASGEWEMLHDRHLQTFLELTEETEPKLLGEYQQLWLNWLEREYDNIRAALTWAWEHNHIEAGLRIAIANYQFWTIRDYSKEGLSWYERLLAKTDEVVSPVVHANALSYVANMSGFRGNVTKQIAYGRQAATIAETTGKEGKRALVWALAAQAYGARAEGDFVTEFELARRMIQINRELDDTYLLAVSLSIWSFSAMSVGEYDEAHAMLDEGLPMLREIGNPYRIAMALNFSGDLARCEKNYEQARIVYEESMSILRDINAMRDLASVLHNLGHVYLHQGQIETARTLFAESMATHQAQDNKAGMAECLIGFAALAIKQGVASLGVRLLTATIAIRGQPATSMWAATHMDHEYYLNHATEQLTNDEIETEQAIGRTLSLEQALSYAEKIADKMISSQIKFDVLGDLTERELEVVILVAQAKSNGEIADELVLSKRTIEKHIANIRSKLGFSKRTEIVRWAMENNLLPRNE